MGMNWSQLSMDDITTLYLYGSYSLPNDLTNDARIRPGSMGTVGATVTLDAAAYMATGAGRFAYGSLSPLINEFMRDHGIFDNAFNQELINNIAHTTNAAGQHVFTKQAVGAYLVSQGIIENKFAINLQQYNYQDGTDDIALRTYIYGSTAFQLVDDAEFVIDVDGKRHIANYAVIPRLPTPQAPPENFDFSSGNNATNILESALINAIDPWGIGRRVDILFDNTDLVPRRDYTATQYHADVQTEANNYISTAQGLLEIKPEIQTLIHRLNGSGVTQQINGVRDDFKRISRFTEFL